MILNGNREARSPDQVEGKPPIKLGTSSWVVKKIMIKLVSLTSEKCRATGIIFIISFGV